VDVRVELLDLDPHPAAYEQPADRGSGDSPAEGRDNPAGYEDGVRGVRRGTHALPSESSRRSRPFLSTSALIERNSPYSVVSARMPSATSSPSVPSGRAESQGAARAARTFEPTSPSIARSRRSWGRRPSAGPRKIPRVRSG